MKTLVLVHSPIVGPQTWSPVATEIRTRAYQLEPIPVFAGWPDAPCGYLRFGSNPAYELASQRARQEGWPYLQLPAEHFHMLVNPPAVAEALLQMALGMTQ